MIFEQKNQKTFPELFFQKKNLGKNFFFWKKFEKKFWKKILKEFFFNFK